MAEIQSGCGRPTIAKKTGVEQVANSIPMTKEETQKMIRVGKPAPAFSAPAFFEGKFTRVNLEDYKGQWVSLCFYPGDFTFV